MDQLKTQLAAVKQHSFWVMCLGILACQLGSWWVSTGKLAKRARPQESARSRAGFDSVNGVWAHGRTSQ